MASGRRTRQRGGRDSNGSLQDAGQQDTDNDIKHMREMERQERNQLKLHKRPLRTLCYFTFEMGCIASSLCSKLWHRKLLVTGLAALTIVSSCVYQMDGPHQSVMNSLRKYVLVSSYWIGLGILSSVGLGTGLHTFLLYLGPFIAQVTLAAHECMSTNFPEPPYPNEIICPEDEEENLTFWTIMKKVRLEAIMWGVGTALGELPPYFMARAARLSGTEDEEEDLEELEELIQETHAHPKDLSFMERSKVLIHNAVQRVGFFGILACASIPNPLFDLAGITCGHFLIPFWTFFGATLIGKAVVKMHIQQAFVIFLFSKHHVEQMVRLLQKLPGVGSSIQAPFSNWLEQQKKKLHHKPGTGVEEEGNLLSSIFEKVVIAMVVYFLISIINSMAQRYHKRLCKVKHIVGDSVYVKKASKTT